jgi:hypothetical protein
LVIRPRAAYAGMPVPPYIHVGLHELKTTKFSYFSIESVLSSSAMKTTVKAEGLDPAKICIAAAW